jgi:hypothetical protein
MLVTRTWAGPIPGIITARSTLTIEALTFLAFVIQSGRLPTCGRLAIGLRPSPLFLLLPIAAILPFLPTLNAPFLFDDFVNIGNAATGHLIQPIGGDGFFRPLGIFYYWLTSHWAAWNPLTWHLTGITIHAANTLLVFLFLKRLTAGGGGVHGSPYLRLACSARGSSLLDRGIV